MRCGGCVRCGGYGGVCEVWWVGLGWGLLVECKREWRKVGVGCIRVLIT